MEDDMEVDTKLDSLNLADYEGKRIYEYNSIVIEVSSGRKRVLLPKAPIKKGNIILREYDVFYAREPQNQK